VFRRINVHTPEEVAIRSDKRLVPQRIQLIALPNFGYKGPKSSIEFGWAISDCHAFYEAICEAAAGSHLQPLYRPSFTHSEKKVFLKTVAQLLLLLQSDALRDVGSG